MKKSYLIMAYVALITVALSPAVKGATINLAITIDLESAAIEDNVIGGNTFQKLSVTNAISPVTFAQGDVLSIDLSFANNQRLEMIDSGGGWNGSGHETIVAYIGIENIGGSVISETTTTLLDPIGQLLTNGVTDPNVSCGNCIAVGRVNNTDLTQSVFSFDGIHYNALITSDPTTILWSQFLVTFYADKLNVIPSVPIPPAIWLFGSGLLGLVGLARNKKTA